MTYVTNGSRSALPGSGQDRPTGAPWSSGMSLRTRLTLSVAASVALVIGGVTIAGVKLAEQLLEKDLRETASVTAVAVADDVELRTEADAEGLEGALHEFMAAAPAVRAISIVRLDGPTAAALASTSSVVPVDSPLIQEAVRRHEPVWDNSDPFIARVATPFKQNDRIAGAILVDVSMASVEHLKGGGRLFGAAATLIAIVGVTLLIHVLAGQMIHVPLGGITRAIAKVTGGDLSARAPVVRRDETGYLAGCLNEMLSELEDLHRSLNERVTVATSELRERNQQLVSSYESVLQLREAVRRAAQLAAVGQTMANVAHQIGTPLNLVSGHVQLLKQEVSDPVLQRRLRIVEEQVERVVSTVRNLLERARPDAERRPIDVARLLHRISEVARTQLANAGVRLDLHVGANIPEVLADETPLELALLNLITNAVDAMSNGGVLSIRADRATSGAHIEIRDTGTGITSDLLQRIFDPWVTTKGDRGTGLGLSIAREVIERFGGTISVASRPGEGSTFTIELQAVAADSDRGDESSRKAAGDAMARPSLVDVHL